MIQDIYPKVFHNEYKPEAPDKDSVILCLEGHELICKDTEPVEFYCFGELFSRPEYLIYLCRIDDTCYYMTQDRQAFDPNARRQGVRSLLNDLSVPRDVRFAASVAYHFGRWEVSVRFCGECGAKTEFEGMLSASRGYLLNRQDALSGRQDSQIERAARCPVCGHIYYPRINPAVIVGVTRGDELLITHYARTRGITVDALVAGFCEIGETLEETVRREVMEETGLRVKNLRYYKSQPWGIAADLLAGFYCEVDGESEIHVDEKELANASWVKREEIKGQPTDNSLTNEMMVMFREGKEPG